jgi:ElaB/YqjD/DUF883 family membrane-anchored ribosome-binding protein
MNEQQQENQVHKDAARVKKDLNTLLENSLSQFTEGIEKLTGDAKESVVGAAETVKKDVGFRLGQYNAKAQEVVDKVPGGLSEKAARYPWVALSVAVGVGFLLGSLFRPGRQPFR